jgi:hypothetical protein
MFMATPDIRLLDLDPSLKPLLGCLSWGIAYSLTNLSMEFGKPSIRVIHEPMPNVRIDRKSQSVPLREIRRRVNRRQVSVGGQWRLWIYLANWRIVCSGACLASKSSSMRKMAPALLDLQGQRLVGVNINPKSGATAFKFDLDTVLEVRREHSHSKDELWILYGVDGYQRAMHGDGSFGRKKCRCSGPVSWSKGS